MSSLACGCDPAIAYVCLWHREPGGADVVLQQGTAGAPHPFVVGLHQGTGSSPQQCSREIQSGQVTFPVVSPDRKTYPVASGVLDYFPLAVMDVAHVSFVGNEQHNPGLPLHWDRTKSTDEADALLRHFLDRGTRDTDGLRHSAKLAWRALALLQKEIEGDQR